MLKLGAQTAVTRGNCPTVVPSVYIRLALANNGLDRKNLAWLHGARCRTGMLELNHGRHVHHFSNEVASKFSDNTETVRLCVMGDHLGQSRESNARTDGRDSFFKALLECDETM